MTRRILAIGDVHGEISLAAEMVRQLAPTYEDTIVWMGDYVDRGENTPTTIDFLRVVATQFHCIFLRGNHEDLMLDNLLRTKKYPAGLWEQNGGSKTLLQYGASGIPFEHIAFLGCTLPFYLVGNLLFVHAGFDPDKELKDQTPQDMFWIREPWLTRGTLLGFDGTVFHGHTILQDGEPPMVGRRVNLDSGAFVNHVLTAAIIEDGQLQIVQVRHDPSLITDSQAAD